MPVQNAEIAAMFDQAAELLEIKGDNPFRIRAYRRAARAIESLPTSAPSPFLVRCLADAFVWQSTAGPRFDAELNIHPLTEAANRCPPKGASHEQVG
ncbi:hypothetical protein [Methylocystis parvus]|uniref:hypothetical protein n=1 Tax=Methylocystis parvus TaxID=134 RepID=UPI003C754B8C